MRPLHAAVAIAAVMTAVQIAAKATRDAAFLSTYAIAELPAMVAVSALVSITAVLQATRLIARYGPAWLVPRAFVVSAALFAAEWAVARASPGAAAVALYLHVGALGAILASGFWSLLGERFDPSKARRRIATIATAATLGGVLGGVMAERFAVALPLMAILPALAVLHLGCAVLSRKLRPASAAAAPRGGGGLREGLETLARVSYVRELGMLVLAITTAAALADFLFKAQAREVLGRGDELMRFFAAYYAAIGVLTFGVQLLVGRVAIEKLGIHRAAAVLPGMLVLGGVAILALPRLATVVLARAAEATARSSIFRSAYEVAFAAVPTRERRGAKILVDVGFDRAGDALGGGITRFVLLVASPHYTAPLAAAMAVLGAAAASLAWRMRKSYVAALESSLLSREAELPSATDDGIGSASVLTTLGAVDLARALRAAGAPPKALEQLSGIPPALPVEPPAAAPGASAEAVQHDPVLAAIADLRSAEAERIRRRLAGGQLAPELVAPAIALLAWDEVHQDALAALRAVAERSAGQLADALLDPEQPFAVRRRVPRVLSRARGERVVPALLAGLGDARFEVRFQCGAALAAIRRREPELELPAAVLHDAIVRETAVTRQVWEARDLIDDAEPGEENGKADDLLVARAGLSLRYVFSLLSLVLPAEAVRVAFRALHTEDRRLRGTALEYLASVLPENVRAALWAVIGDGESSERPRPSREESMAALLRSTHEVEARLAARGGTPEPEPGADPASTGARRGARGR